MNLYMLLKYLESGELYDIEPTDERKINYPDTVGLICFEGSTAVRDKTYVAVYKDDVKDFYKLKAKCEKKSLDLNEEIKLIIKKIMTPTPFASSRGKRILKDGPFIVG